MCGEKMLKRTKPNRAALQCQEKSWAAVQNANLLHGALHNGSVDDRRIKAAGIRKGKIPETAVHNGVPCWAMFWYYYMFRIKLC